jgi:hypothetical protein
MFDRSAFWLLWMLEGIPQSPLLEAIAKPLLPWR